MVRILDGYPCLRPQWRPNNIGTSPAKQNSSSQEDSVQISSEATTVVPSSENSGLNIPQPADRSTEGKIYNICINLRPREFRGVGLPSDKNSIFNQRLEGYFKKGDKVMDKKEFCRFMGLNESKISDQFWKAFTGGKESIESMDQLLECLENCERSLRITGDTLETIYDSKNILLVSVKELGACLRGLGLNEGSLKNNPWLRDALLRAKALNGDSGKEGFEDLKDKTWEDLAFILYNQMIIPLWRDSKCADKLRKIDLADDMVADLFYSKFKKFVTKNEGLSEKEIDKILARQEKVKAFRTWAEKNKIDSLKIKNFDPTVPVEGGRLSLDLLIEAYRKGSKTDVEDILIIYQRKMPAPLTKSDS